MACACKGRSKTRFVWTSADGRYTTVYATEIQAKAKVKRAGGAYVKKEA